MSFIFHERYLTHLVSAIFIVVTTVSCGSASDEGFSLAIEPKPIAFLPYIASSTNSSETSQTFDLRLVELSNENQIKNIDIGIVGQPSVILSGSSNNRSDLYEPAKVHTIVYVKDKKLWKLNLSDDSNPIPKQMSSANVANICHYNESPLQIIQPDSSSPEQTIILFEMPGLGSKCDEPSKNRAYIVTLNFSLKTPPIEITEKVDLSNLENNIEVFFDSTLDSISILTVKGNELFRHDMDFVASEKIQTPSLGADDYYNLDMKISGFTQSGTFLRSKNQIYWYSYTTNTISDLLQEALEAGPISDFVDCDITDCYFYQSYNGKIKIHKIAIGGASEAELVKEIFIGSGEPISFNATRLTKKYIYLSAGNYSKTTLYRIDKAKGSVINSEGSIQLLDSVINSEGSIQLLDVVGINEIYYNKTVRNNNGSSTTYAKSWSDDEANTFEVMNARWVGFANLSNDGGIQSYSKIIMAKDDFISLGNVLDGVAFDVYGLGNSQFEIRLGELPGPINFAMFHGYNDKILGMAEFKSNGSFSTQSDILFADVSQAKSLSRKFTNTPNSNEEMIFVPGLQAITKSFYANTFD